MKWQYLERYDSGDLKEEIVDDLQDLESTMVVFWNSKESTAEIIDMACFVHVVNENTVYTHYLKLACPKVDRRRKEFKRK